MSWNLTPEEVLNRWVDTNKPQEDDEVLLTFCTDTMDIINEKVENIDDRIILDPALLRKIYRIASAMIQRAWGSYYERISSYSWGAGPHNESFSKDPTSKQGLFLENWELNELLPKETSKPVRIWAVASQSIPRPNFDITGKW